MLVRVLIQVLVRVLIQVLVRVLIQVLVQVLVQVLNLLIPSPCGYDDYCNQRCTRCLYWTGEYQKKIKKYFIEHRTTHCVAVQRTAIIVSYLTRLVRLLVENTM